MNKTRKLRAERNSKSLNIIYKKEVMEENTEISAVNLCSVTSNNQYNHLTHQVMVTLPEGNCSASESPIVSHPGSEGFSLCSCCLELPCPKNMWTEYTWMGHTEVYGDMLRDCFGLSLPEELKPKEQICEVCITRLRNSLEFKHQVVQCHMTLLQNPPTLVSDTMDSIKLEKCEDDQNNQHDDEIVKSPLDFLEPEPQRNTDHAENSDDDNIVVPAITQSKNTMKKIVKADLNLMKTGKKRDRRTGPRTDHIRPRENIGLLLQYTTILPFKSNKGYFNCFYCNKQYVVVEELRGHVEESHGNVTLLSIIKNILRPHDRIKADISNITCKICSKTCKGMEDAVKHLEGHEMKFNYDEKLLKPTDCLLTYDLSDGRFKCVVCNAEFHFFKTLTKHMNEHSTNYVCDVCGKCFLLSERLKAHSQVHASNASVHCDVCGKLCATAGRLRSHKRHHHKKRSHVCSICNESFPTFRQRMQHLQEIHHRSPLDLRCKLCLKTFKTTSHLGCHMRTEHFNIPYVRKRKKVEKNIQRVVS